MSIICWDGTTLAADKQSTCVGYASTVTKIYRVPGGVVGFSGYAPHARALLEWFIAGHEVANWPASRNPSDSADSLFISNAGDILEFIGAGGGYFERVEDRFTAMGAGRDYALAAMYLGKTAREAVEVAIALDNTCGMGIDTLELSK